MGFYRFCRALHLNAIFDSFCRCVKMVSSSFGLVGPLGLGLIVWVGSWKADFMISIAAASQTYPSGTFPYILQTPT